MGHVAMLRKLYASIHRRRGALGKSRGKALRVTEMRESRRFISECADVGLFSALAAPVPPRPHHRKLRRHRAAQHAQAARIAAGRSPALSRRASPVAHAGYRHHVLDVSDRDYAEKLRADCRAGLVDTCIYCAGIGGSFDPRDLRSDVHVFEVNLLGALRSAEVIVPAMVAVGRGHFVVLSSQADVLVQAEFPSYAASNGRAVELLRRLGLGFAAARRGGQQPASRIRGYQDGARFGAAFHVHPRPGGLTWWRVFCANVHSV